MQVLMAVHSNYDNDARVKREAEALFSLGFNVTVAAAWPYDQPSPPEPYELEGVQVVPITLQRGSGIGRFAEMMSKMYRVVKSRQFDLLHLHDADTLLPGLLAASRATPVIYDSHEWYPGNAALVGKNMRRRIWQSVERFGLSRIHTLITVNQSIQKLYREFYHYNGEARVLRNFASINPSDQPNDTQQSGWQALLNKLKEQATYLAIYSGHLTPGRGLIHYLEAIKYTPGWGLIIAGGGSCSSWLQQKIESMDLNNRVKFAGMLSHGELYPLIQTCDAGLCYIEPVSESYYYALPNKISEYVQLGVPVIGSNLPEIAGLIRKYNIGYIAKSPTRIAECLNSISRKEHNFTDSLKSARQMLSWDKEKQELERLYQSLASTIKTTGLR